MDKPDNRPRAGVLPLQIAAWSQSSAAGRRRCI